MKKKEPIPTERFSEQDTELLVKHYGKPPPESKVQEIMKQAQKERDSFRELNEQVPERKQSQQRDR